MHSGLRPTAAPTSPRLHPGPQAARELAVGDRFSVGHAGHQLPDPLVELASPDVQGKIERASVPIEELAELAPKRYEELSEDLSEERLETICRQIMLYHLDRGWADHLAYLADIRESIHLRALGRQNPLDEFHRLAVDAFASLAADAIEAAQQTFETANVLEEEQGLDLSKLARPTSTWTYMVNDNPLSDDTLSTLSLPGVFR